MKKVEDTFDRLGNPVEVWISDMLLNTPTIPLVLKVWAELIEKGWALPTIGIKNSNKVVWVQDSSGTIQGGIVYDYMQDQRMGWGVLAFTDSEYRGRGINKICHKYYESECKNLGASILGSLVAIDNESRIKSAAKVGIYPKFYRMHKHI